MRGWASLIIAIVLAATPAAVGGYVVGRSHANDHSGIVVGAIIRCEHYESRASASGSDCIPRAGLTERVVNQRIVLTVRTGGGDVYTTEAQLDTQVGLGDRWPPKK